MAEKCLLEPDEIRAWVEERGGTPTVIRGVDEKDGPEQPEMLHLSFGPTTKDEARIGWPEFFDRLESQNLAIVCDEERGKNDFSFIDKKTAMRKYYPESDMPDTMDSDAIKDNEYPTGLPAEEEGI
jgi:hypothetical protein